MVVSAPGRDEKYNEKITDHLLNLATNGNHFKEQKIDINTTQSSNSIIQKFEQLCIDLEIEKSQILADLKKDLKNTSYKDDKKTAFFLSRGSIIMLRLFHNILKSVI